ncbi:MAG TPA: glycosyltransferase 87 family protein [Candidatus Acidoferrales bacterium]|nr:glycosyltransferase 87 family protein [Candidatus Acidoferrales bacterium]
MIARATFAILVATAVIVLAARAAATLANADISDFRCFYEASRLVAAGGDPYDRATWEAATAFGTLRAAPCDPTFIYPLWTALALVPLTALPEPAALGSWEALTFACIAGGTLIVARTWHASPRTLLLVALWSEPTYSVIANAQLGGVTFIAAAALQSARVRSGPAVVAASVALFLKPHVVALTLAAAIVVLSRRTIVLVASVLFALVAATLALRPTWPLELAREVAAQRRVADVGLETFWGLATAVGVDPAWAALAAVASAAAIVVAAPRRRLNREELIALAIPASLVVTPYARPHDFVALLCCYGALLTRSAKIVVGVGVVFPWLLYAFTFSGLTAGFGVLVPLATAVLVARSLPR